MAGPLGPSGPPGFRGTKGMQGEGGLQGPQVHSLLALCVEYGGYVFCTPFDAG